MKASDLRIGNYIYSYQKELICRVSSTNENNWIICFDNGFSGSIKQFNPIPISEEWMKIFGFKNFALKKFRSKVGHWQKGKMRVYWQSNKGFRLSGNGIKIKYVHHLQNLYHALNEKELSINPSPSPGIKT